MGRTTTLARFAAARPRTAFRSASRSWAGRSTKPASWRRATRSSGRPTGISDTRPCDAGPDSGTGATTETGGKAGSGGSGGTSGAGGTKTGGTGAISVSASSPLTVSQAVTDSVGGNITLLTELCEKTRSQAYELMSQHADQMGANAIIGVRYDATEVMQGVTEVLAYGTAVVVEPSR